MKKVLILICFLIVPIQMYAQRDSEVENSESLPVKFENSNLNHVFKIEAGNENVVFFTPFGEKSYCVDDNIWNYKIYSKSISAKHEHKRYNRFDLPEWYDLSNSMFVCWVDNEDDPEWMIVTNNGSERPKTIVNEIINTKSKKVISLDIIISPNGIVEKVGDVIWFGSYYGLIGVDIKTEICTNYISYPMFTRVRKALFVKGGIFYLDKQYGLFAIDKERNKSIGIDVINNLFEGSTSEYMDMIADGEKIYIIINNKKTMNESEGEVAANLLIYDVKTQKVKKIRTKVSHVNNAVLKDGKLFAWEGGLFIYDVRKKKILFENNKNIFTLDISDISEIKMTEYAFASSAFLNFYKMNIKDLELIKNADSLYDWKKINRFVYEF